MQTDHLSLTFAALADPTRRSILTRLADGEATVNELAEPFAMSLPAISRHLKVLERAGLIVRSREAQWRPAPMQAEPPHEAWGGRAEPGESRAARRGGGVDAVAQAHVGSLDGPARRPPEESAMTTAHDV